MWMTSRPSVPEAAVSDHAVLRYLERVLDLDVDAVRGLILSETKRAIAAGASAVVRDGVRYVILNRTVVTVLLSSKRMALKERTSSGQDIALLPPQTPFMRGDCHG